MFKLEEITTKDGLVHQGLVALPHNSGEIAYIWVHGLTGDFYGNTSMLTTLAEAFTQKGMAFGSFNNRGHDMITSFNKVDPSQPKGYSYVTIGAGYEKFEESIEDIDAAVNLFVKKGYAKIILIGHSSGANKVSYYAGTVSNPHLAGAILLCPMSDRLDPRANKEEIQQNLQKCFSLIEQGRGDALITGLSFFPMTANRFVSLVTPNTLEDQFGYGDTPPMMVQYEHITIPLFVGFADKDEYADRPIDSIKKVFDSKQHSSRYESVIFPGVFHNLAGQEKRLTEEIFAWAEKIA